MSLSLDTLSTTVQRNCNIADAQHAGDYTLCVYLLKMREYFRWEKGYTFNTCLPSAEVGAWVTERERLWEELQSKPFEQLPVNGHCFDPFSTASVNAALLPQGLVYSGGLGANMRPHFFLADLLRDERNEDFSVLVSAKEHARDLTAPPAMTLDKTIYVRRESLQRMLWEKVEEWRWKRYDNAMGRALAYYDFDSNFDLAMERMTDNETRSVVLHEIGEVLAGKELGAPWHDMLVAMPRSKAEIAARAVRDHLADCLSTLPGLIATAAPAPMHFYFANMKAIRKQLFPSLMRAYEAWSDDSDFTPLAQLAARGKEHWLSIAQNMLSLFAEDGVDSFPRIESLIEHSAL